jgi:hypothetical protein
MTIPHYISENKSDIRGITNQADTQGKPTATSRRGRFLAARNASAETLTKRVD